MKLKVFIYLLFTFIAASCSFTDKTSTVYLHQAEMNKYDVIIVPGVPFQDTIWSQTMKARVYWSWYLYDRGITEHIIYSGSAVATPYIEAEIMALYGQALGIPREKIFTETKAEHSTENAYYAYKYARQLGFDKIAIASDPFQTKLLRRYARKVIDPDVGLIPIVMDTLKSLEPWMIDPEINYNSLFINDFIPLNEREGFWERFKGTRGKSVDTTLYSY